MIINNAPNATLNTPELERYKFRMIYKILDIIFLANKHHETHLKWVVVPETLEKFILTKKGYDIGKGLELSQEK